MTTTGFEEFNLEPDTLTLPTLVAPLFLPILF